MRSYVVDDSGTVVKLVIAPGEPGADPLLPTTYIPVWNGHGDAVNLSRLNADGTLTLANSYRYDTWGKPSTTTHNSIPDLGFRFLYVGEFDVQWDDQLGLGLLYMHARHYSPALGRFVQPDPDRSEANLYAYAANNPVTEMDPDGTCFIVCQLIVGAVIDSVVYFATTENASLGGLAKAVAGGAVESAVNPFAKINKVMKLAKVASKIIGKVPKAKRLAQRVVNRVRARPNQCELVLRCPRGATTAQRAEMRQKAADLDRLARAGKLVKTAVAKSGRSATGSYRKLHRAAGRDWDHIHELQLGGRDIVANLRRISSRINRSAGAQISRQLRRLPYGTRITRVRYLEYG